jgi:hypothetical protein
MADLDLGVDLILNVIDRFVFNKILNTGYLYQDNDKQNQEQNAANNP